MSNIMSNSEVQEELSHAIAILDNTEHPSAESYIAHSILTVIKELADSGNSIPGLRGLGMEDALKLSHEIKVNGIKNLRFNTKALSNGITVK